MLRDQSRHCGVSAAGTDPNGYGAAKRATRQAADESFAQKSVMGMSELMVVLGIKRSVVMRTRRAR